MFATWLQYNKDIKIKLLTKNFHMKYGINQYSNYKSLDFKKTVIIVKK